MPEKPVLSPKDPRFQLLVFSLGMVELISYWKIVCPPHVRVLCGSLNDDQIQWWKEQYFAGLGEFFYKNEIPASIDDFMELTSEGTSPDISGLSPLPLSGAMIPVGGGKDSIVTMELLRESRSENACYIMNPRGATTASAEIAGFRPDQIAGVHRTLDKRMLELNKKGALNGHTPFSALVAFSGVLAAAVCGKKYLVLSNESSANESTVAGSSVNHQYSKSFQFEKDFNRYENTYIGSGVHYFSLLRPWTEFQIAARFAELTRYHSAFRSCNAGSKTDSWCGNCPKCLFVWVILSPFLSTEQLEKIFGKNLARSLPLWDTLRQLCGMTPEKPFECVGSRDEICFALVLAISRMEKRGEPLPELYQLFRESPKYEEYRTRHNPCFESFNEEHLIPAHFLDIMRRETDALKQREALL